MMLKHLQIVQKKIDKQTRSKLSLITLLAAGCASSTLVPPMIVETCMNEQGCEPDCLEDEDCDEGQRCVEGACYDNECESGDSRECEGVCGVGVQRCVGGIWRGCSTAVAQDNMCAMGGASDAGIEGGGSAGTGKAGVEGGAEGMSGMEQGGGGVEGGSPDSPTCDPTWTEVCMDLIDQDCDGRVDEGCEACPLQFEEPLRNEGNVNTRFDDEQGYVKLNKVGSVRRGVISRSSVNTRGVVYGLGSSGPVSYRSERVLEAASVRSLFTIDSQLGLLARTSQGLELQKVPILGTTGGLSVAERARVTEANISEETLFETTMQVSVAWTEGANVKVRTYNKSPLSALYDVVQVTNTAFRSGGSSLTQTSQKLTIAYEDERNQGEHPDLYITGVSATGSVDPEVNLGPGYTPKLLWSDGALYLTYKQRDGEQYGLYFTQLDPDALSPLQPPKLIYTGGGDITLSSFQSSPSGELHLLFKAVTEEGGTLNHKLNLLYLTTEGRPSRGPFTVQVFPNAASSSSSDVYFDQERGELTTGWTDMGFEDTFNYYFMQIRMTYIEPDTLCPTSP